MDTWGRHPALFVYDPRPLWRALGETYDVIDVHEEPFALATAEVLLLRWLRRNRGTGRALYRAEPAEAVPSTLPLVGTIRVAPRERHLGLQHRGRTNRGAKGVRRSRPGDPPRRRSRQVTPTRDRPSRATHHRRIPGSTRHEKGLHTLLDAAALEPRLRVRIAGAGPLAGGAPRRPAARGLADRVDLLGAIDPDAVPAFYPHWTCWPCRPFRERAGRSSSVASRWRPWPRAFPSSRATPAHCPMSSAERDSWCLRATPPPSRPLSSRRPRRALQSFARRGSRGRPSARGMPSPTRTQTSTQCDQQRSAWDDRSRRSRRRPGTERGASEQRRPLEIIVVAFGAPELLRRALEPVRDLPVTVVDNSSLPEIAALCDAVGVRYIDAGRNGGFAAGVNVALRDRLVPGADVLLLNPDAVISADDIAVLHDALAADRGPRVGRARADRRPRPSGAGRVAVPEPGQRMARGRRTRAVAARGALRDRLGAAAARGGAGSGRRVRRAILPLRRGDRLGLSRAPARVAPHGGRTTHGPCMRRGTSTDPRRREAHFFASQERFYRKHFGAAGWQSARAAVWLGAKARCAAARRPFDGGPTTGCGLLAWPCPRRGGARRDVGHLKRRLAKPGRRRARTATARSGPTRRSVPRTRW